jgi:hypothetical protein
VANGNRAAFGIYPDTSTVNDAVEALKASGFRQTDISILYADNVGSKDFGHERNTKAPEGAVVGGGVGLLVGGLLGWLVGSGMVPIPGMEFLTSSGPVLTAIAAAGVGTWLGAFVGAFFGGAMPEYEAKRYEGRIRKGGILLSVHCDNHEWEKSATQALKRTGAVDIGTETEARADFAKSQKPMPRTRVA